MRWSRDRRGCPHSGAFAGVGLLTFYSVKNWGAPSFSLCRKRVGPMDSHNLSSSGGPKGAQRKGPLSSEQTARPILSHLLGKVGIHPRSHWLLATGHWLLAMISFSTYSKTPAHPLAPGCASSRTRRPAGCTAASHRCRARQWPESPSPAAPDIAASCPDSCRTDPRPRVRLQSSDSVPPQRLADETPGRARGSRSTNSHQTPPARAYAVATPS